MEFENITIEEYVDGLPEDLAARLGGYFTRTRDAAFGRWREGPNSSYVCYPVIGDDTQVVVFDEATGLSRLYRIGDSDFGPFFGASQAYFRHNPPTPKEWMQATEGEVWVLTLSHGQAGPYFLNGGLFQNTVTFTNVPKDSADITNGEKLWPRD